MKFPGVNIEMSTRSGKPKLINQVENELARVLWRTAIYGAEGFGTWKLKVGNS